MTTPGKGDREDSFLSYELVKGWPAFAAQYPLGQVTGVGTDTAGHILLIHRAGRRWVIDDQVFPDTPISAPTILVLDAQTGAILRSWGSGLFSMPHGLTVDRENNVWLTDVGLHQVIKCSPEGRVLMKLGVAGKPGTDSAHFNKPTDVALAADGSFYVSDGYGNSRVVKFSRTGKFLFAWGSKGDKPGQFNLPHAVDLDSNGHVYVADRENKRIQEFDSLGRFLKQWKSDRFENMYSLCIDKKSQALFAVDFLSLGNLVDKGSDVLQFRPDGTLAGRFGRTGHYDGPVARYHDIALDREGNIYVGDILGNRIWKFRKKQL